MIDDGSIAIPEVATADTPTSTADLDAAVAELGPGGVAWRRRDVDERIDLLRRCSAATLAVAGTWVETEAAAKGIAPGTPLIGEVWLAGPTPLLRNLRLLTETLEDIRDHGEPQVDLETRDDGQVVARVMPMGMLDQVVFPGYSAEIWMDPDATIEDVREATAAAYHQAADGSGGQGEGETSEDGVVALVLGAGNISAIAPTDALYRLFVLDHVVVLKTNPVNAWLVPILEQALAPLVEVDALRIVRGGAAEGAHLATHPDVDELFITGSDKTYDEIVFGSGEEGARRKAADDPVNPRPFAAELGNVTPIIVVPGPWSDRDLAFQAENLASMLTHNAGYDCVSGRVIVTHRRWAKRAPLLEAMREDLRAAPPRTAFYPGARERWRRFVDAYPQAETLGDVPSDEVLPWTLIAGVDPEREPLAIRTEVFGPVLAEVPLDAPTSVPDFIEQAVAFANDDVWGTLAVTLLVHPASLKDPAIAAAIDAAVADLRFGTVMVNHWPGLAFGLMSTSWGAFPGHDRQHIESGTEVVHNASMLAPVQKSVVRGPFRPPTKPVWFHSHRSLHEVGPRIAQLEATSDVRVLPGLLWHGLRG